jgi:hypothetical protein
MSRTENENDTPTDAKTYSREVRKSNNAIGKITRSDTHYAYTHGDTEIPITPTETTHILQHVSDVSAQFQVSDTQHAAHQAYAKHLIDYMNIPLLDDAARSRRRNQSRDQIGLDDTDAQVAYLNKGTKRQRQLTDAERTEHQQANQEAMIAARTALTNALKDDCRISEQETTEAVQAALGKLTAAGTSPEELKRATNLVQHIAATTNFEISNTEFQDLNSAAIAEVNTLRAKENSAQTTKPITSRKR